MNAMTRQRQKLSLVRLAGAALLIIAVWGATGMQAQTPSAVVAAHRWGRGLLVSASCGLAG